MSICFLVFVLVDSQCLCWVLINSFWFQLLNSAWDRGLTVAGQNADPCYDRGGFMRIVEIAKPRNDPDHRHFLFFVHQQPSSFAQGTICLPELDYFVKSMHGMT